MIDATRSAPAPTSRRIVLAVNVALALLVLTIFAPTVGFEYLNYDDPEYVTGNADVQRGLSVAGVRWALTTTWNSYWHPVTWLSHLADRTLFGPGPAGPHAVNVLLHAVNTLLVFAWLRRATGALVRSAIVAVLFAVHPLHVESVAWVAERKDVLSACFFLLTLIAYTRYAEAPQGRGGGLRLATAWGCFVLAAASKPMVVTLPFVLLLLDVWPLRRLPPEQAGRTTLARCWLRLVREKAAFFAVTIGLSIVTCVAQDANGAMASLERWPLLERLGNAAVSYTRYLSGVLWPTNLAVFYPYRTWPLAVVAGALLALALVTAFAFRARRERPFLLIGWCWFLGMLVPAIGVVQVGDQAMADRYMYLPLLGLLIAGVWRCGEFASAAFRRGRDWRLIGWGIAATVVLVACIARTSQQLAVWRDSETLFGHAIAAAPGNFVAHNNLGSALLEKGDIAGAIAQFEASIRLQPRYAPPHSNIGLALLQQGLASEAVPHLERALETQPDFAEVHFNLAEALRLSGTADRASVHYRRAVELRADLQPAQVGWGADRLRHGDLEAAVSALRRAVTLDAGDARAWAYLGDALVRARRPEEALEPLRRSLALAADPYVRFRYGFALLAAGQAPAAAAEFGQLVAALPGDAELRNAHGWALLQAGRVDEASEALREAVRLDPASSQYRSNLRLALSRLESTPPVTGSL